MPTPNGLDREQLLSILQTAEHRLEYVTPNDWALLIDRTKRVTFKKEETLIKKGKQTRVLYLLVRGTVKIEAEFGVRIAQIGPGQICGEVAFLEDGLASATATAEHEVEACAIDWSTLRDLFELYPHVASRFYRSLAVNLSRRLRRQIMSSRTINRAFTHAFP
jgi:CRP/FNR family cyclic AMP-dependent transcriptional regulator